MHEFISWVYRDENAVISCPPVMNTAQATYALFCSDEFTSVFGKVFAFLTKLLRRLTSDTDTLINDKMAESFGEAEAVLAEPGNLVICYRCH